MNSFRLVLLTLAVVVFFGAGDRAQAQDDQDNQPHIQPRKEEKQQRPTKPAPTPQPAKEDDRPQASEPATQPLDENGLEPGESSSKDSQIDLNAGPPRSSIATASATEPPPYDPHRAGKDLEVGNYYLRQKNYRAALERFRDALRYKPDDAEATYGLAVTQEKMDLFAQSYNSYSKYLEILPHGPMAKEAEEGMKRMEQHLSPGTIKSTEAKIVEEDLAEGEKHLASNEYGAARQSFEHAMRLNPDNAVISFRLAQSLQGLGQPNAARMYYQKYLELQPGGPLAADAKKNIAAIDDAIGK